MKAMKKIAVAGGGKIGIAIAELLGATGDYRVTVFDRDAEALERMPRSFVETRRSNTADAPEFAGQLEGHDIVLSATPYSLTATVAQAAKSARVHYLDL